jgi:hypothetical protein
VNLKTKDFANEICPTPNNYCDGTAILDRQEPAPSLKPCPWYDIDKGCQHPDHPKKIKAKRA